MIEITKVHFDVYEPKKKLAPGIYLVYAPDVHSEFMGEKRVEQPYVTGNYALLKVHEKVEILNGSFLFDSVTPTHFCRLNLPEEMLSVDVLNWLNNIGKEDHA